VPQFLGSIKLSVGAENYCRLQNSISAENLGERFHLFIAREKKKMEGKSLPCSRLEGVLWEYMLSFTHS